MKNIELRVFLVALALSPAWPQAGPAASGPQTIEQPRPLFEVAQSLTKRFSNAVTYEEPILVRPSDVVARRNDPEGPTGLWAKDRHFTMPEELDLQHTPKLDLSVLRRIVDAYNSENRDGTQFQATESPFGLHILPVDIRAANGDRVKATSLLDTRINVASALRMPSEHFQALADAVTTAQRGALKVFYTGLLLDIAFKPNGLYPPKGSAQLLPAKEKEQYSTMWGASDVTARIAGDGRVKAK
jgi:hypothetical protein